MGTILYFTACGRMVLQNYLDVFPFLSVHFGYPKLVLKTTLFNADTDTAVLCS